ncbi:MAG: class I SAM-dependent methyltransferase [Magnetospirillum sp.]|nr:class I SAM-dependent methyltransferase [Magnetospirillum sp.]
MSHAAAPARPEAPAAISLVKGPRAPDVGTVARVYAANRFIPVPPSERHFVGDGDFRAIGAEFLGHFVRLGGLAPTHRVLEIGCGIGRMALPLTQWLSYGAGSYDGVDVVKDGIAWCAQTITPAYGNFRFHHLDYRNPVYNPVGNLPADRVALPFADGRFDFVVMTSVLTHLDQATTEAYAAEMGRLLRPGGRCFLSLFLMNDDARAGLRQEHRRLAFDPGAAGPEYQADPANPGMGVAFDDAWLMALFARHGLRLGAPVAYGHWSGRRSANYQDLLVLVREEGR